MTSEEFLKQKSRVGKSRSRSHVTTIIQDFTLVSLTSSVMPYPAGLPLGAALPSLLRTCLLTYSSPYVLVSLHTRLPTHLSYRYVRVPAGRTFRLDIYLRSSTCRGVILDRRSIRRGSWAVGWTQLTLLPCVVVSLVSSQPE